ncbi:maleylacetoacetate isomerase [Shewanella schlegeliana]|uniref:Maleylacetoacetate isomerase n=1 Tax=Shewanella schlegeliana TaxID=190308 RepID=A0ABS1ST07_9GAMM|nr:maleylacetoacetate isomerase [Shewanella schlegeliana]MBL4911668.1 maleylacetoacetate isomerase [Shewanella schlegeliana]MCL1111648.1 maleylacetoacetate isomerase [Shewanella schlegeliana]GIU37009.1 maleylacetoacetate isomerase [Shewanella schlegeliana]
MKLYGYWRSSAAYRVRIAMNLKSLVAEQISVHLVKDGGEQHQDEYQQLNAQELVPSLVIEDNGQQRVLTQSLAIIEYLDEVYPKAALLPNAPFDKSIVRAMALTVACEIHPLNNLKVLQYLASELDIADESKTAWYHHWVKEGFTALEKQLAQHSGLFCFGDSPTLADICLVPQVYNAKRFKLDMRPYPNINRINAHCLTQQAFIDAIPENQLDAS